MSTDVAVKKKKKIKFTRSDIELYIMCILPLLQIFIFRYLPMSGLVIAFKNYKYNLGIWKSPWVGFKNFEAFFSSNEFVQLLRNTLLNNILFIITGIIAAVLLAILLFELKSRTATKVFQTILITPNFLSWVVVSYMTYAILNTNYGYLNQIVEMFGGQPVDWYSKPMAWPIILTIVSIWKNVGMDSIYYYASLMGIDTSLFEAAEIDGANKLQRTMHIVIPSLVPLVVILTILKIGGIFHADFGLFYTVTQDGANGNLYSTTNVIDTYTFRTFKDNTIGNSYGLLGAISLLQSIVGMLLVIGTNWLSKKVDDELGLF